MLCARRISLVRALAYILSQMAGAIVGSALVLGVDPQGHKAALGASNRLNDWVSAALQVCTVQTKCFGTL
jgi:glycerol uptake facilitator-like aquaporin